MAKTRKRLRRAAGQTIGLVGAGVGIGIGAQVVEGAGGSGVPIARLGSALPIGGTLIGAGLTTGLLSDFGESVEPKKRKRRRR